MLETTIPSQFTQLDNSKSDSTGAVLLAVFLVGLLTALSLSYPPSVGWDAGNGMITWRSLLNGGPINTDVGADPENISRDAPLEAKWWSPGQYLVPGILTLTGLRLGTALTITAAVSLLICLLGWIRLLDHFGQSSTAKVLTVLFISTASYSTLPFAHYDNGEILLQGFTPWLVLIGLRAPACSASRAGLLAAFALFAGFLVKLTGIIVAAAALAAGIFVTWVGMRRITQGIAGVAAGAAIAALLLYFTWFWHADTPASRGLLMPTGGILFAAGAPWGAGVSWLDMLELRVFRQPITMTRGHLGTRLFFLAPLTLFGAVILRGRRKCGNRFATLADLTLCFYGVCALALILAYARGGVITLEERHVRSSGTLILVSALAAVTGAAGNRGYRLAVFGFCSVLSLSGAESFVSLLERPPNEDPLSRTRQQIEMEAIGFARQIFAREGRNALFVITSPDTAIALPADARILRTMANTDSVERVAKRQYKGTVNGSLCVIMHRQMVNTVKAEFLLKSFSAYPYSAWERHQFGTSQIFVQRPPLS